MEIADHIWDLVRGWVSFDGELIFFLILLESSLQIEHALLELIVALTEVNHIFRRGDPDTSNRSQMMPLVLAEDLPLESIRDVEAVSLFVDEHESIGASDYESFRVHGDANDLPFVSRRVFHHHFEFSVWLAQEDFSLLSTDYEVSVVGPTVTGVGRADALIFLVVDVGVEVLDLPVVHVEEFVEASAGHYKLRGVVLLEGNVGHAVYRADWVDFGVGFDVDLVPFPEDEVPVGFAGKGDDVIFVLRAKGHRNEFFGVHICLWSETHGLPSSFSLGVINSAVSSFSSLANSDMSLFIVDCYGCDAFSVV